MKKSLLFLSLVIICFWGCSSSEDVPPVFTNPNPVNLSQLEAGQKSYYRRYQVDCGSSSTFRYTGDTARGSDRRSGGKILLRVLYS